jgi:serine/threonine protein kinase
MTEDRWRRVKALFQAAVERPPAERGAFLITEAGADEALRREVESLIAADTSDEEAGPWRLAVPNVETLRHLGPYDIVAPIGAGAMGEVYRARDTKLNRDVALKVLPPLFALDPDRVARFKREAQVLAALSHSNIAAIYGLEESQGLQALVHCGRTTAV